MGLRRIIQAASALMLNPFLPNFLKGTIHKSAAKGICVPALNCYSCPAAFGACPVGSLQVTLSSLKGYISQTLDASAAWTAGYVAGFIALVGAIAGRFPCGWVCPFGLLQDLLCGRGRLNSRLPGGLRLTKYLLLLVLVLALPLILSYPSSPLYCKYVCPAGTIEAGLALVGYDRIAGEYAFGLGWLFAWKVSLAAVFVAGMVFFSRFFCRTACPLGASWGLLNRVSLVGLEVDSGACTRCGLCRTVCPVDIGIFKDSTSAECIRCLKCIKRCPESAIKVAFRGLPGRHATKALDGGE